MSSQIGELLVNENIITKDQLEAARDHQKEHGGRLDSVLINLGFVQDEDVTSILSKKYGVPSINLSFFEIDQASAVIIHVCSTHHPQSFHLDLSSHVRVASHLQARMHPGAQRSHHHLVRLFRHRINLGEVGLLEAVGQIGDVNVRAQLVITQQSPHQGIVITTGRVVAGALQALALFQHTFTS